ncbi:oligopeptidase A [Paraglaciecola chathamensis]|uniref:oligopeptidase A n=1 Tax=Paraglaciecola agarilytica NO2 TaxID=1125747 RepID=A0ABQ0I6Q6_9ALTE|nr:oligopeptidase A [Paraglaciecola agarilytica]GAC05056.1 oligopeptidase A [Paraglaciecola agarilytica NO2]
MSLSPLQDLSGLPRFSDITPDQIQPSVEQAIEDAKKTIETLLAQPSYTWDNFAAKLEDKDDELGRMWSPVSHMNSVVSNDELREAHDACLPLLSEYGTWVGQHKGLYQAYLQIQNSAEFTELDEAKRKVIDNTVRDFELSGVGLDDDKKQRYGEIKSRLSDLSSTFSNNVMDATLGWQKHITDEKELAGLPESALAAAKQLAESKELDGWLFTLDIPSYLPVMMHADNHLLREEMYRAFTTRASDQGPNAGKWDNGPLIDETMALRQELAELLDFANYAERSLATKMAESTTQVNGFLQDLAKRSKPQAQQDLQELTEFAKTQFDIPELQAWDLAYYSEKLKEQKYAISDEALRPYFPAHKAVDGLFEVVSRLYGLNITERTGVDNWHKDVRFFDIKDAKGELRGSFYLDLYAREHKRGGAWMDECQTRRVKPDGSVQLPVAYLTCNFSGPVGDKPALFTHDEVITLFHEFGHGIHHMLTQIDIAGVSGINGVAWDAVELPSQFLENWCWQPEALAFISSHYETGEPLPQDLLDKMLAARNFQSAMQMVRQLEFSMFDFSLHEQYNAEQKTSVQALLDDVRSQVSVVIPPEFNRFQNSFGHIFAGGYAAGYYSYKWAEVLSSDAFSRFEEEGIFNQQVGQDFLNNILEKGGSKEPMELFVAFRGREPKVDALLRHSGIEG